MRRSRRGRRWVVAVMLAGCASSPGAGRVPEPVPPPKGAPPPRLDPAPDPAPAPGAPEPAEPRFLILEGRAREEARRKQARAIDERLELLPPPGPDPCRGVAAEEQRRCPLSPTFVEVLETVPGGVRLHLRPGSVSAGPLRRSAECQAALARRRPAPQPCAYLTADTRVVVAERRGRIHVDLLGPDPERAASLVARVRRAFPRALEEPP